MSSLNEDSSNRVRSTSLTSDTTNRRVRHMTGVPSRPATHRHSGPDEKQALLTFHQELTETCVDLMSRYSFANCGVTPRRDKVTAFLLSQGQSSSWILGTMILTVTVSGCAQAGNRGGFCDMCAQYCSLDTGMAEAPRRSGTSPSPRVGGAGARVCRSPTRRCGRW